MMVLAPPPHLTPEQRALWADAAARAEADVNAVDEPLTLSVTLDRGGGLDGREHFTWCLIHQTDRDRCPCRETS